MSCRTAARSGRASPPWVRQIRARQAWTREDAEVLDDSLLPEGWTLARVREIEPSAELLDPADHHVVADERPASRDYQVLRASAILSFSGLCLCLVSAPGEPDEWWMGQLDSSDGSIVCWSDYGPDLEAAIRGLKERRCSERFDRSPDSLLVLMPIEHEGAEARVVAVRAMRLPKARPCHGVVGNHHGSFKRPAADLAAVPATEKVGTPRGGELTIGSPHEVRGQIAEVEVGRDQAPVATGRAVVVSRLETLRKVSERNPIHQSGDSGHGLRGPLNGEAQDGHRTSLAEPRRVSVRQDRATRRRSSLPAAREVAWTGMLAL